MIELRELSISIGGRSLLAHVSGCIADGEFVALLGPNGAGKTTLLRTICGLHPVRAGSILLDGVPSTQLAPLERARRAAFVTGDEVLLDALRVWDVVSIGRFPHHRWWEWRMRPADHNAIASALAAVRMEAFAERLLSTLSAGERQRVWIALGLAQETPVLLLDEPTSHLDVRVAHEILELLCRLARHGKIVVSALHDLNEAAAYADRIALLGEGTLVALAPPAQVLTGTLAERVYGIAIEQVLLPGGRLRVFARENSAKSARPSQVPNE
jgi:ABC-type cobalamin/Fe3+-siderophores transport system ATPase subunit